MKIALYIAILTASAWAQSADGLGESITAGMYNNDHPTEAEKQQYYEIVKWAAERGPTVTQHWSRDASVGELLSDSSG